MLAAPIAGRSVPRLATLTGFEFPMDRPRRVGLPWYAPEHYEALRAGLADGAKLPPHYETWRIATEQMEREVQRSGVEVVRVPIEPDVFAAWCARTGVAGDGPGRARYAAEAVAATGPA